MPLLKGKKNIGKNIKKLAKEGYGKAKSLAIAIKKSAGKKTNGRGARMKKLRAEGKK